MANQNRKYRSLLNWLYVFALLLIIGLSMAAILSLIHQTGDAIDEELYFPEDKDNPDQLEYADYVASAAKEFGVDEAIIYAIIYCESKFDPEVVSSVGARGLMQIMPATFEEIQEELGEKYHIKEIAFDRWGAVQMTQNLEGMGFTVVPFGQGFKDMSPPTKELMKLVLEQKIAHGGNVPLRWMMDNVFVRTDPAGNIKMDKEKSTERIDGAVATVMALDRAIRNQGTTDSIYNDRGIIVI